MYAGWCTVTANITLTHKHTEMSMTCSAKLCGWCRRQSRRNVFAQYPGLAEAAEWDQEEFNRLARYEEIDLLATGLSRTFPTEDFRINTIFVWQTNRYVDYPLLEAYNCH